MRIRPAFALAVAAAACKPTPPSSGVKFTGPEVAAALDLSKLAKADLNRICAQKSLFVFLGNGESIGTYHFGATMPQVLADDIKALHDGRVDRFWKRIVAAEGELREALGKNPCKALGSETKSEILLLSVLDGPAKDDSQVRTTWFGWDGGNWKQAPSESWTWDAGAKKLTAGGGAFELSMPEAFEPLVKDVVTKHGQRPGGVDRAFTQHWYVFKTHGATVSIEAPRVDLFSQEEPFNGDTTARALLFDTTGPGGAQEADLWFPIWSRPDACALYVKGGKKALFKAECLELKGQCAGFKQKNDQARLAAYRCAELAKALASPDKVGTPGMTSGTTGEASGTTGEASGTTGEASGTTGEASGTTGEASGTTGEASGTTGEASGTTGEASGTTGEASGPSGDGVAGGGKGTVFGGQPVSLPATGVAKDKPQGYVRLGHAWVLQLERTGLSDTGLYDADPRLLNVANTAKPADAFPHFYVFDSCYGFSWFRSLNGPFDEPASLVAQQAVNAKLDHGVLYNSDPLAIDLIKYASLDAAQYVAFPYLLVRDRKGPHDQNIFQMLEKTKTLLGDPAYRPAVPGGEEWETKIRHLATDVYTRYN